MGERRWAQLMPRESGQRHQRWKHLFAPPGEADAPRAPASDMSETQMMVDAIEAPAEPGALPDVHAEIVALREEIAVLRARIARLESADGDGETAPRV
jgi:uncharacterized protein YceH (UPF0502 family)